MVARLPASPRRCEVTGKCCHISGAGFDGWIAQEQLWGVHPNELVP